jgi:hypothetical protein
MDSSLERSPESGVRFTDAKEVNLTPVCCVMIDDPQTSGFVVLSTANKSADNFFASQINGVSGMLDTQGSWGTTNHNAAAGINVAGGRQGCDNTGVALTSTNGHLAPGQQQTTIRTLSTDDELMLAFVALEVDSDDSLCPQSPLIFADGFE